jgi:hypothetical protein
LQHVAHCNGSAALLRFPIFGILEPLLKTILADE